MIKFTVIQKNYLAPESKEQRGENSSFLFLGRTVRADMYGQLFLGSQKSSQMAPYAVKSKNEESFVDINNLLIKFNKSGQNLPTLLPWG
jgi:hypothetical protein